MKMLWMALLLAFSPALALAQDDKTSTASEEKGAPSQETADPEPSEAPKIAIEEDAKTGEEELVVEENPSFDTRYPTKKYIDAVLERSEA